MNDFATVYTTLSKLPASKWHTHETYLCHLLSLKTDECHTSYDELDGFVRRLKKGGVGVRKPGQFTPNSIGGNIIPPIDLSDTTSPNDLHTHFVPAGRKVDFKTSVVRSGSLKKRACPRYFQIGRKSEKEKAETIIDIRIQLEMVEHITGTHKSIQDSADGQRRRESVEEWAISGSRTFQDIDLPIIMDMYHEELGVTELVAEFDTYSDADVKKARNEIVDLLYRSNHLTPRKGRSSLGGSQADDDGVSEQNEGEEEESDGEERPSTPKRARFSEGFDISIDNMRKIVLI